MQQDSRAAASLFEFGQLSYAALEVWLGAWMRPEVLRQRATQRLQRLIDLARKQAPFYAQLYADLPASPALTALPVVTKPQLMRDVSATLTDRALTQSELTTFLGEEHRVGELLRGRYAVWTTSGTTGEPGVFVHDAEALAVYEALETLRFRGVASLADYAVRIFSSERFAMVAATGGHFAGVSSIEHLRRTFPWLANTVRTYSLMVPVPQLVKQLDAYQPTLLATYPTAAEVLADEQEAGRLHLRLTELWAGGEYLCDAVRARLQRVFGCRVRNGYGASEFLSIAAGCPQGALHINADWVLLEPVDAAYRPVPPGTASHTTLLTNLANRAQPLIRYDLGDSITVLPGPCACGSNLPAVRVEGRHDDVLRVSDVDGHLVKLLPLALTTVLEEGAQVYDFQLTQTATSALRVALGPQAGAAAHCAERVRASLLAYLAQQRVEGVTVDVVPMAPQRSRISGKLRRVVCGLTAEHAQEAQQPAYEPAD